MVRLVGVTKANGGTSRKGEGKGATREGEIEKTNRKDKGARRHREEGGLHIE